MLNDVVMCETKPRKTLINVYMCLLKNSTENGIQSPVHCFSITFKYINYNVVAIVKCYCGFLETKLLGNGCNISKNLHHYGLYRCNSRKLNATIALILMLSSVM